MLQNAATYLFAGLSAMIAVGLATWQVARLAVWPATLPPHDLPREDHPSARTYPTPTNNLCCPCADYESPTKLHAAYLPGTRLFTTLFAFSVSPSCSCRCYGAV